jgi:hypothetical protein
LYYNEHTAGYGGLKTEMSFWPSSGAAPNSALAATEMGQTRFPACFIFRPCMHASRQCMRTYLAPSADTQRNKGALIGSTAAAGVSAWVQQVVSVVYPPQRNYKDFLKILYSLFLRMEPWRFCTRLNTFMVASDHEAPMNKGADPTISQIWMTYIIYVS